jgi:hypothetical protein
MSFSARKAADYLRGRFKDSQGLCCESIDGEDDKFEKTFWLMNDNALAIVALDRLNETPLRDKIKAKLQTFRVFGHDAFRNRGWVDPQPERGHGRIESRGMGVISPPTLFQSVYGRIHVETRAQST